jgi:hypothetical protein
MLDDKKLKTVVDLVTLTSIDILPKKDGQVLLGKKSCLAYKLSNIMNTNGSLLMNY